MLLRKIWERYFFLEAVKTAFFFLFCFYALYVLIDYAHHAGLFRMVGGAGFDWQLFFLYYASEFIQKCELLVPLAILLGSIRVLCKLNEQNELVALMAGGVSAKNLMKPFILLGIIATALLYINNQFLLPKAAKELVFVQSQNNKGSKSPLLEIQSLILADQSTLLFQRYDLMRELFLDVYWIRSAEELYRIKALSLTTQPIIGYSVDTFRRNAHGALLHTAFDPLFVFDAMKFDPQLLSEALTLPEAQSLTELWAKLPSDQRAESEKQARLLATFHQKILFPWFSLLAVLAPAPFCMQFSRHFPVFLIYACSLFGFMAMYIIINAAHVLGRRQFFDPVWAIWGPFLFFALLSIWQWLRKR